MRVLDNYLRDLRDTYATGENVKETSFYPALSVLLNSVGAMLNPKVRVVINIRNRGAGLPDGGLFTARQLKRLGGDDAVREPASFKGQQPERGVVEVKSAKEDIRALAQSEQVRRYLQAYGQVMVTNLREFLLVTKDQNGELISGESYQLAAGAQELLKLAQNPQAFAAEHDAPFTEYLKRVMLTPAPLEDPKDLAWFLASYARDAKARIEHAEMPSLHAVREALEQALELKFEGARGEAFFRSTLVQTLFYGIFSAWVLWAKSKQAHTERFNWQLAAWSLHVPVIRTLFEQVVTPSNVRKLGLGEVLDWTAETLNRVRREEFFTRFEEEHAVQYFYEPFLEAFDPELRKQLGVWYTPEEIVRYMVERVDRVLRSELGIEDGLADERVYVLDPCCGTGAYLVEVLRRIKRTIDEQGGDALTANDLKRAAQNRVFGFEILPAPFVVAHLQLGLLLQKAGSALKDDERVGVYLTNALTGWEPPQEPKKQLTFEFHTLQEERDAAEEVKRNKPILVVLGNPPYNGYAGVAVEEERKLSDAYRTTKRAPAPQGQGLNDLYVRFFRVAERRIVEMTGEGIVCFISNYSWLDGLSFTGMRERYLEAFDMIEIDCLNGDKYKTGKVTPEGKPDPSVFSTEYNREGIQVGTAISLLVRRKQHTDANAVKFRHFWGSHKRDDLLDSLNKAEEAHAYDGISPAYEIGLPFMPLQFQSNYIESPLLPELFPVSFPGVKTSRDDVVVDIDRGRLAERMKMYFDPEISHEEMRRIAPGAMEDSAQFKAKSIRERLIKRGFQSENIIRYCYRPFDVRWLYWEPETKLLDRNRAEYIPHVFDVNVWIEARQKQPMERFDRGYVVRCLGDNFGNGLSNFFPLLLRADARRNLFSDHETEAGINTQPNLSDAARTYLRGIDTEKDFELLFFHTVAVLHTSVYRTENAGALRQDWPRVPLPASRELLEQSAALGKQIAALLDTETSVSGVTSGSILPHLRAIAVIRQVNVADSLNLEVNAGWGHHGKGGIVMPGKGRLTSRDYAETELAALRDSQLPLQDTLRLLGTQTHDVYLNDTAVWMNVPARVWDYTIGGYQVIKKWLSYREISILSRPLSDKEAREVTQIARRIAAILLLETDLDQNYERIKANCYSWNSKPQNAQ
ncbi:MAG: type ISP restriction/modification enzyme [Blastocatellia bacterium]